MIRYFSSSALLKDYVWKDNAVSWYGRYGLGSLLFIDSGDLYVVFDTPSEYESWRVAGCSDQISLF